MFNNKSSLNLNSGVIQSILLMRKIWQSNLIYGIWEDKHMSNWPIDAKERLCTSTLHVTSSQ